MGSLVGRGLEGVGVEVPGVLRPGSRGCLLRFIFLSGAGGGRKERCSEVKRR